MRSSCRGNTFDPQVANNIVQALTKIFVGEKSKPVWYLPRAAKRPANGRLQRFPIIGVGELTQLSVKHRFPAAIQVAGDHWDSGSHRLQEDESKPLLPARHDKNIGD